MDKSSPSGSHPPPEQVPVGVGYVPTEEERRVFKECNQESFWYRSVPLLASSMALTQFLISRGTLTASTRFGSVPKVLFAGMCGYFAGKLSYMKTCQEKFKRLENSPLGEALRQRGRRHPLVCPDELNKDKACPEFQSDAQRDAHPSDFSYSLNTHSPPHEQVSDDEEVQKKPVFYEDLRSSNREGVLKSPSNTIPPKTQVKNIYGDTWEE